MGYEGPHRVACLLDKIYLIQQHPSYLHAIHYKLQSWTSGIWLRVTWSTLKKTVIARLFPYLSIIQSHFGTQSRISLGQHIILPTMTTNIQSILSTKDTSGEAARTNSKGKVAALLHTMKLLTNYETHQPFHGISVTSSQN
jgi:hypothetical protein